MSRIPRLASAGLVATAVLAVAACGSTTGSSPSEGVAGATGTPEMSEAPSAEASAAASAGASGILNQATVQFQPVGGSSITGGAILTDLGNDQTAVTIGVVAAGITDPMPAALEPGDCATLSGGAAASPGTSAAASAAASAGASAAPAASGSAEPSGGVIPLEPGQTAKLTDLTAGASNTVIGSGLDALLSTPYAIVIRKSATDTTVVACADVVKS